MTWQNGHGMLRTLCFYNEPQDGDKPTYIAETLDTPGKRNYDHHRALVAIGDIRGRESDFSLHTHSFAPLLGALLGIQVSFQSATEISTQYIPHVRRLIMETIHGAKDIIVFNHVVRKASSVKIPSRQVRKIHIDQSPRGALKRAQRHLDKSTFELIEKGEKRFLIVNVWKSIRGTVKDHPLAFADCRSLRQSDLVPVRQIYPDYVGETYAVRHSNRQEFWYWSGMTEEDVLLLQCFDSAERVKVGQDDLLHTQCAHGSFELNEKDEKCERESIEVRCLVVF